MTYFIEKDRFPVFRAHEEAQCFHCHSALDADDTTPIVSGYPTGSWERKCQRCLVTTFYDIAATEEQESDQ